MELFENNSVFTMSTIIILLVFLLRLPVMSRPKKFSFEYSAKTRFEDQDHTYIFSNRLMHDGYYRCYIERSPFLFGKRFSRYTIDYGYDKECGKCYILSTRRVSTMDEAKNLCAEWSDFNQYIIDSHRYSGK